MGRRRSGDDSSESDSADRGVIRTLLRFFVFVALIGALAFGTAMFAPTVLEDLGIDGDEFTVPNSTDTESLPAPSSEPPPTGERNPAVTDPADPNQSAYETDVETVESETVEDFVHAEVNDRRADHGLEALEWDGTVASVARAHSYDMADREYFDHVNPDGEEPMERFTDVDDYCRGYGENIAQTWVDRPVGAPGGDDTAHYQSAEALATGLVDQWMNSTPHRQAILEEGDSPTWDRGGVGVYIDDDGAVYASHNFCVEW